MIRKLGESYKSMCMGIEVFGTPSFLAQTLMEFHPKFILGRSLTF